MTVYRNSIPTLGMCGFLLIGLFACDSASNTEDPDLDYFVKYYGGDGNQSGVDFLALDDGTFLLLGNHAKTAFDTDVYLVRVDAEGDVIWETTFGNPDEEEIWRAIDLERASDGNFVVLADYQQDLELDFDTKVLKFSPEGAFLGSATYSTQGNDYSRSITPMSDGGFIVSGTTDSTATFNLSGETDPDLGDIYNFRVDQNLVRYPVDMWSPVQVGYGSNVDVAVKALPNQKGNFYVFGYTNSTLAGDLNPNERLGLFYFEREPDGSLEDVWYPGNIVNVNDTEINFVRPVDALMGGGFLVIGTSQNNVGVSEIFLAKMRPSLTFSNPLQNEATFYNTIPLGRNLRGVSASVSVVGEMGYFILANEVRGTGGTGPLNIWLSKIDQSGIVLWSTTFGSEGENDTAAAVTELPDGKVVILGTMGLADNQFKMAFIKMNRRGQLLK